MHQGEDEPDQSFGSAKLFCDYLYYGQGTGTRSAALLVFCLLSSHENYSWRYVSDPIVVLHCLFWWLLFSLSYCLPLDIDLSWKSSNTSATCKMEAKVIQLPSWVSFSVFIIVTGSLPTTHVCLQPHFFFWSSSENFQLRFKLPAILVLFTCLYPTLTPQLAAMKERLGLRTVISPAWIHPPLHLLHLSISPTSQSPSQKPTGYPDFFHIKSNITF